MDEEESNKICKRRKMEMKIVQLRMETKTYCKEDDAKEKRRHTLK